MRTKRCPQHRQTSSTLHVLILQQPIEDLRDLRTGDGIVGTEIALVVADHERSVILHIQKLCNTGFCRADRLLAEHRLDRHIALGHDKRVLVISNVGWIDAVAVLVGDDNAADHISLVRVDRHGDRSAAGRGGGIRACVAVVGVNDDDSADAGARVSPPVV